LVINVGIEPAAAPEPEPAVVFTNDAPLPGATKPAVSLEPVNSICPVSGKAIDRKFLVVHDGKVVGLCCEKCTAQFLLDPAKFPVKTN
jgi:hypothetical protein